MTEETREAQEWELRSSWYVFGHQIEQWMADFEQWALEWQLRAFRELASQGFDSPLDVRKILREVVREARKQGVHLQSRLL